MCEAIKILVLILVLYFLEFYSKSCNFRLCYTFFLFFLPSYFFMLSANLNYVLISVAKGESADIQAMEPDGDYGPCLCIFDILLYNGIVLSNKPLQERVAYIKKTFNQVDNKIRFTEQKSVSTKLVYIYIILIIIYQ